jgi:putative protease
MKDMAIEELVKEIPALSLKIEGRKKSDLYVASVTNYYRKILDNQKNLEENKEDIKQIFSRPCCKFHINGKTKDITDENFVGHRGLLISKVQKVNKNTLTFKTNHQISRYDGIQIDIDGTEKPYGFGIQAIYVNKKSVFSAPANTTVEVEIPTDHPFIKENAPIYLASSTAVKGKYTYNKPKPQEYQNLTPIDVTVEITENKIWAMSKETAVSLDGTFEKAKDIQKVKEAVEKSFNKTGGTSFYINSLQINNNKGLFAPISVLNELRRILLDTIKIEEDPIVLPELKPYENIGVEQEISTYRIDIN